MSCHLRTLTRKMLPLPPKLPIVSKKYVDFTIGFNLCLCGGCRTAPNLVRNSYQKLQGFNSPPEEHSCWSCTSCKALVQRCDVFDAFFSFFLSLNCSLLKHRLCLHCSLGPNKNTAPRLLYVKIMGRSGGENRQVQYRRFEKDT